MGAGPALVVGVGASAGGLDAYKQLLRALPTGAGLAVILVQHLDPTHKSLLTELLDPCTELPVCEAVDGMKLAGNAVYVIPPDTALAVREGRIRLTAAEKKHGVRLPIDHLFRSLASECGTGAAGVVLTGAGSDGSSGLLEMKMAGALTIAQDPATSTQFGMPQAAIDSGSVDLVLPIEEIPAALVRFSKLPLAARMANFEAEAGAAEGEDDLEVGGEGSALSEKDLEALAAVLEAHAEFDLRVYKRGTVQRRSLRRMVLAGFEEMPAYLDHLREDGEELQALVRDLLISVTSFYRDGAAFEELSKSIIKPLVAAAAPGETLRAWVAGCATGEEAYSVALTFLEAMEATGKRLYLQIFATDVDRDALAVARQGIYPSGVAEAIGAGRLERYFKALEGHGYQVRPALRDTVSFAVHDLTSDPPFSRMDLVTCRNVLIYFRPKAQDHILRSFHFALNAGASLFLGTSEAATSRKDLFKTLSKKWRIYRKIGAGRHLAPPADRPSRKDNAAQAQEEAATGKDSASKEKPISADDLARRTVLRTRVPPTIVVDGSGEILFMHGELRPYLRFPDGKPRLSLTALVSEDLATRSRACLYKCRRDGEEVIAYSSPDAGRDSQVRITASPAPELADEAVVLSFEDAGEGAPMEVRVELPAQEAVIDQLEKELVATREDLHSTVEELESSNEELRSSNEESMSMNEELQSANEELEATTEELRSLNEEITTVNSQLREKVDQIEVAHDDLENFFSSTKVATLFLDENLRIKRSTPAADEVVEINEGDTGRYVVDIARELLQNDLAAESRSVLDNLTPRSSQIELTDGRWISRKILPYRTSGRRIEGVVVTFTDISEMKDTTMQLQTRERQQAVVASLGISALEAPDVQTFLEHALPEIQQVLGSDFCKVLELQPGGEQLFLRAGIGWDEGIVGEVTVRNDSGSQGGFTMQSRGPVIVTDLENERRFSGPQLLTDHGVSSGISCPIRYGDTVYGVLGVHCRAKCFFTAEDADFVQSVAAVIAGTLQHDTADTFLQMEAAVGRALALSEGLNAALKRIHTNITPVLGECVAELWDPEPNGKSMRRSTTLCSASFKCDDVEACLQPQQFAAGQGPIGRVFLSKHSEWVTVCQTGTPILRIDPAKQLGLRCGFAIPVMVDETVRAVITIICREHYHADAGFLKGLDAIGRIIGDFITRTEIKRRLRATVADAPIGIADRSLENRWLHVNRALCAITGFSRSELLGRASDELTHPDDLPREKAMREGDRGRYVIEKRFIRKDGTPVWVCQNSSCVPSPPGKKEYWIDIIEDISGRRTADIQLRESEARFRQILKNSPVPMMVYDEEGAILAISDSLTATTGYSLEQMPDLDSWLHLAFPDRVAEMRQQLIELRPVLWGNGANERTVETEIRVLDGGTRTVLFSSAPLERTGDGPGQRIVAAADITRQRRTERDLIKSSEEKDEFIAMLGHELRNPLAAMTSAAGLLESGSLKPEMLDRVQAIVGRQTAHMGKLLDGLLDVSRVIQNKIKLDLEPTDFAAVVREVLLDYSERPGFSDLKLVTDLPENAVWVEGDPVRLTQIFDNLLSNAAKYTSPPGTITVRLSTADSTATLVIEDTGDGLDADLLSTLFEPFRQGSQSFDRSRGGLGIGLALVRRLIQLHGGNVEAASPGAGKGSTFTATLPLTSERPGEKSDTKRVVGPLHILIIEDNADAAELLRHTFELAGHRVTHAATGIGIIDLTRSANPDAILCDLGLPDGVTGFDVAKLLRSHDDYSTIPLIALSGYGRPEDKKQAADAGFDRHVTKPVSAVRITGIIGEIRQANSD